MEYRDPTPEEFAEMLEIAYSEGLEGSYFDKSYGIMWDELIKSLEYGGIALPERWDDPQIKAIQKAFRKGRRDAREA